MFEDPNHLDQHRMLPEQDVALAQMLCTRLHVYFTKAVKKGLISISSSRTCVAVGSWYGGKECNDHSILTAYFEAECIDDFWGVSR